MLIKLKNLKCLIDSWYNKISNSKTYQKWSVIVFCFLCFAAVILIQIKFMLPLDQPIFGHDVGYHLLRTEALKQRIEDMNFFNGGIDYLFYNGAGYASSLASGSAFIHSCSFADSRCRNRSEHVDFFNRMPCS